MPYRWI